MRSRVLDATIECLVELGYANTSTRHIAKRAGVTVGALQHHFAGKAELMAEAVRTLSDRMAQEFLVEAKSVGAPAERIGELLDRVWRAHRGPLFTAGLELSVAARTDPVLNAAMSEVANAQSMRIVEGMLAAFPDLADAPGFAESVLIGLATLRGLAMTSIGTAIDPDLLWAIVRPQLLKSFEESAFGNSAAGK